MEGDEDEEMTMVEGNEGSPVVFDSDLDNFWTLELEPFGWFNTGGHHNQLVQIKEESLDEVEELVMNRVLPEDQVVHRLVPIEDSPKYELSLRYLSVEL